MPFSCWHPDQHWAAHLFPSDPVSWTCIWGLTLLTHTSVTRMSPKNTGDLKPRNIFLVLHQGIKATQSSFTQQHFLSCFWKLSDPNSSSHHHQAPQVTYLRAHRLCEQWAREHRTVQAWSRSCLKSANSHPKIPSRGWSSPGMRNVLPKVTEPPEMPFCTSPCACIPVPSSSLDLFFCSPCF